MGFRHPITALFFTICLHSAFSAEQYELDIVAIQNGFPECRLRPRSEATNNQTVWIFSGESIIIPFCLPTEAESTELTIADFIYSNDGWVDHITFAIDGQPVGDINSTDTSYGGELWNVFERTGEVGRTTVYPGQYSNEYSGLHILEITVDAADKWGIEYDALILDFGEGLTADDTRCPETADVVADVRAAAPEEYPCEPDPDAPIKVMPIVSTSSYGDEFTTPQDGTDSSNYGRGGSSNPRTQGQPSDPATGDNSSNPGNPGDSSTPGNDGSSSPVNGGDSSNPGKTGDTSSPGNGDNYYPGDNGDSSTPVNGGNTSPPGNGGDYYPGNNGDSSTPGNGGDYYPGNGGDSSTPGNGGDYYPGNGGESSTPGNSGDYYPGNGGESSTPGNGGDYSPGNGGDPSTPGNGGDYYPGNGGDSSTPANGGDYYPGNGGDSSNPANGGDYYPDNGGDSSTPGNGGDYYPNNGDSSIPVSGGESPNPRDGVDPSTPSNDGDSSTDGSPYNGGASTTPKNGGNFYNGSDGGSDQNSPNPIDGSEPSTPGNGGDSSTHSYPNNGGDSGPGNASVVITSEGNNDMTIERTGGVNFCSDGLAQYNIISTTQITLSVSTVTTTSFSLLDSLGLSSNPTVMMSNSYSYIQAYPSLGGSGANDVMWVQMGNSARVPCTAMQFSSPDPDGNMTSRFIVRNDGSLLMFPERNASSQAIFYPSLVGSIATLSMNPYGPEFDMNIETEKGTTRLGVNMGATTTGLTFFPQVATSGGSALASMVLPCGDQERMSNAFISADRTEFVSLFDISLKSITGRRMQLLMQD